jgi:hypothetical protein
MGAEKERRNMRTHVFAVRLSGRERKRNIKQKREGESLEERDKVIDT